MSSRALIAITAERAGADGLLLLPPYLVHSEQQGLAAHVEAVCASTKLGVIVYNRDNAMLNEDTLAAVRPLSEPRRLQVDLCRGIADRGDLRPAVVSS
jgi:dihydrodipicolinate synthase/N-acetylneuraminate lyase